MPWSHGSILLLLFYVSLVFHIVYCYEDFIDSWIPIYSIFSRNSEADATEFLENIKNFILAK